MAKLSLVPKTTRRQISTSEIDNRKQRRREAHLRKLINTRCDGSDKGVMDMFREVLKSHNPELILSLHFTLRNFIRSLIVTERERSEEKSRRANG